eukprot:scaffold18539_cov54-Phaeocystis_antarctica.AAC.5
MHIVSAQEGARAAQPVRKIGYTWLSSAPSYLPPRPTSSKTDRPPMLPGYHPHQVAHTKTESHILKQIRHPFLTRMHFAFQSEGK